jgi:hypothetical protein
MRTFNWKVFVIAGFLIVLLQALGYLAAYSDDEGTMPKNSWWQILVKAFYVLRFPTHNLFWKYIINGSPLLYFYGLLINCLLYTFLIERLAYFFFRKKR